MENSIWNNPEGRLQEILDTMDVPVKRKNDVRWLIRNLRVRNGNHKDFNEAIFILEGLVLNQIAKDMGM